MVDCVYALVDDVTPGRATVVAVGTGAEIRDAYYASDDEQVRIVLTADGTKVGDRVWHEADFVRPDSLA